MELDIKEWIGQWDNFENYINSHDKNMLACWEEAESICQGIPMFSKGVKAFWQQSCKTITEENSIQIYGWNIKESNKEKGILTIEWLTFDKQIIEIFDYILDSIVEKGLESKPNYLLRAINGREGSPFTYILAMHPMPERSSIKEGGLLSHFHFQFAGSLDKLVCDDGKLAKPMWYATMCSADVDLLDQCNIVRVLHRLPRWDKLIYEL